MPFPKTRALIGKPFGFPDVWQVVSWNSTMYYWAPALLIITLTTNECTYKTHRQNVIDGGASSSSLVSSWSRCCCYRYSLRCWSTLLSLWTWAQSSGYVCIGIWENSRFVFFLFYADAFSHSLIAFLLSMLGSSGRVIGLYIC